MRVVPVGWATSTKVGGKIRSVANPIRKNERGKFQGDQLIRDELGHPPHGA